MDSEPQFPIGAVAKRTGLSTHTLRAWERRYGVVSPGRSEGGSRLYSNREILRLRLLRQVTESGMGIAQASKLSLEELTAVSRDAMATEPSADGEMAAVYATPILAAIEAMDASAIHRGLSRAAVSLGVGEFTLSLAVPLLRQVGELWAAGRLCPAHEHLFSVQLRRVLESLLASLPVPAGAPGVVATTPSGQAHELGAMLAAVVAAGEGWRVTYLGPDLPAADVATAADVTGSRAVLLSVVSSMEDSVVVPYVDALQAALDGGAAVLVGGSGSVAHADALGGLGVPCLSNLEALATTLRSLAPGQDAAPPAGGRA